ncbi:hypothetical protein Aph01nite_22410 [Acrocarpospora phusangensis]|uniref:Uncharacterized protein n=1 Tax=Acrocarpospora phusangensis TaxID=1070424 RepID=A0A919Q9F9_9ACTN|nr:hypothetical protein [Acrocarpospora phusangensis]GIH23931.1 hypothetical protein Aph01nite_22410 [Acrocarpospora phusangensis]
MESLDRYDHVDLSHPPVQQKVRSNPVADTIEAVLSWPLTAGMALLMASWKLWQTRVPPIIKIISLVALIPPGLLLVYVALAG